jgi:tetratricopeptide (TPR) repeat protein
MVTLYDLLGALPRDDADDLRAAFRRAVKGAHPDLNPGDPEAGLKFRQIVRAIDILGDVDQRAAYDHLLDLADQERRQLSKRAVADTLYQITSGAIAFAVALAVIAGGYLVFTQMPGEWSTPVGQIAAVVRQSTETTAAALRQTTEAAAESWRQPTETVTGGIASPSSTFASAPPPDVRVEPVVAMVEIAPPETNVEIPVETFQPTANMIQPETGAAPPVVVGRPLDLTLTDARAYREHGVVAYRNGDFNGAIADFDQAIQLDPKFAAAYIDRGIVFYRLRKFNRAFADISRAKHIEKASRAKPLPPQSEAKKMRPSQPVVASNAAPGSHRRPTGF